MAFDDSVYWATAADIQKKEEEYLQTVTADRDENEELIPEALQRMYATYKYADDGVFHGFFSPGAYIDVGGLAQLNVEDLRLCIVSAPQDNLRVFCVQGYANLNIMDCFTASACMIGTTEINEMSRSQNLIKYVEGLTVDAERKMKDLVNGNVQKANRIESFYQYASNDPVHYADSTYGVYIFRDEVKKKVLKVEKVLSATGMAVFNPKSPTITVAFGIFADVNTFKGEMNFSLAGSLHFKRTNRQYSIAGEIGFKNGKFNSFGIDFRGDFRITGGLYFTQLHLSVVGFQEPSKNIELGVALSVGEKITVPSALDKVRKIIFPGPSSFYPLTLSLSGMLNTDLERWGISGAGYVFGHYYISASVSKTPDLLKVQFKAGTTTTKLFSLSILGEVNKTPDYLSIRANFNGSFVFDWKNFIAVNVGGGIDANLFTGTYRILNNTSDIHSLTITVNGMAKVKVWFISFDISVQTSWVIDLKSILAHKDVQQLSVGDIDALAASNPTEVIQCESVDLKDVATPVNVTSDGAAGIEPSGAVIAQQTWDIDEQCSKSGIAKFQIAAQYTLLDSSWRLIYTDGNDVTAYTPNDNDGKVKVKEYTHNYCELLVENPGTGTWTLEIIGDEKQNGKFYLDAVKDEKIITELKILSQTEKTIEFGYTAYTGSSKDDTQAVIYAEQIDPPEGQKPFVGVIGLLAEAVDGTWVWEIPDELLDDTRYRFYISMSSSQSALPHESARTDEVTLVRQQAELQCAYELVYSADDAETVTVLMTITNTGVKDCAAQWQLSDRTNGADISDEKEIASGNVAEIAGNSTITVSHQLKITDELRDSLNHLKLSVGTVSATSNDGEMSEVDGVDHIYFAPLQADFSHSQKISWDAVEGAASYILQYALEGDWDTGGVFVRDITDTEYTLSVTPGKYEWRVVAMDSSGNAIGSWSDTREIDLLYRNTMKVTASNDDKKSRSEVITLDDGIYDLSGSAMSNFTGTMVLYRNDMVEGKKTEDSVSVRIKERKILTLKFKNGELLNPYSEKLLDHGDYFWEWQRSGKDISESEITLNLSGKVFSIEEKDREIMDIDANNSGMLYSYDGYKAETLEGEVGFSNEDAVYEYMTDKGGELTLAITGGTVMDAKVKVQIYEMNGKTEKFHRIKTISVKAGEYKEDTLLINDLVVKNNFYIKIISWDKGKGKYNTDYKIDMRFDAFGDVEQHTDILEVDGDAVHEWIGYGEAEHRYLMQIDEANRYAIRLQGDAGDATLIIRSLKNKIIKKVKINSEGKAFIDDINLDRGNYFVEVVASDKGKGKRNTDYTLSVSTLSKLYPEIDNSNDTWKLADGLESFDIGENIEAWLGVGDKADFFKIDLKEADEPGQYLKLTLDENTAQAVEDGILKFTCVNESGRSLAVRELESGQLYIKKEVAGLNEVFVGVSLKKTEEDVDYSFETSLTTL